MVSRSIILLGFVWIPRKEVNPETSIVLRDHNTAFSVVSVFGLVFSVSEK